VSLADIPCHRYMATAAAAEAAEVNAQTVELAATRRNPLVACVQELMTIYFL